MNNDDISRLYRAVVADAGTEGITRREAIELVLEQARPMVERGELVLDVDDLIRNMVKRADEHDGNRADHVLAAAASGADDLGLDVEPILDLVVVLGRGRRKAWRFVNRIDLDEMNTIRYGNVRSAQTAYYKGWKPQYDAWLTVLLRQPTIGAAVAAGDLPGEATLFGAA